MPKGVVEDVAIAQHHDDKVSITLLLSKPIVEENPAHARFRSANLSFDVK